MRGITRPGVDRTGPHAPRPIQNQHPGDPGKGRIGVRRPDPLPEADTQAPGRAAGTEGPGETEQPEVAEESGQ